MPGPSERKKQRKVKQLADEMFNGSSTEDYCMSESDGDFNEEPIHSEIVSDPPSDFTSDESDEDDFSIDNDEQTLLSDLGTWVNSHQLSQATVNELLTILIRNGLDVPKDYRTLMKTPRYVDVVDKCGGSYFYLGIQNGVSKALANTFELEKTLFIELTVNVDGLPLHKSTNSQLWPILGSINSSSDVFVIGIFHGVSKPNSVSDYLHDFIVESSYLIKNGLLLNGTQYPFSLKCFISDAPARSFLKCTIGHSGYNACERCTVCGERVQNRTVYNSAKGNEQKRTGDEFNEGKYLQDHQKEISPLADIGIDCIKQFPLDYMHLVCLGVVKRILTFLIKGPNVCKISQQLIGQISDKMSNHSGLMPSEFNRQPRRLSELCYWKSTEFRQFILYHGPIVLKGIVNNALYKHFLSLHVSITLLLNSKISDTDISYARDLLCWFVNNAKVIYGESFNVYNVHSLIHIADDVEHFKTSLNSFSAFKFENFMQVLKKYVRGSTNPISQVIKRLSEHRDLTIKHDKPKSKLNAYGKDSFFFDTKGDLHCIIKVIGDGYLECKVVNQRYLESFYCVPLDSKQLGIYYVRNSEYLDIAVKKRIPESEVHKKSVRLPYKNGYVFFPLLHFFGENKY